jgi:ABC-2 type transport system ATP-binding protein
MFIDRGRIVLECSMEEFDSRYLEVMVSPEHLAAARALKPMHERPVFGRSVLLFDHVNRDQLETMGEVRRPSIADLFVAVMSPHSQSVSVSGSLRRDEPAGQADQVGAAR